MKYYSAYTHNIVKAMAGINYPIGKQELLEKVGDKVIQKDFDQCILFRELIEKLPQDSYSCACEFYNNIQCVDFACFAAEEK